jgi:predicted KAP-like P-loop ATPase
MTEDQNFPIKGDRAVGAGDQDKLGFRDVAQQIAKSLVDRVSAEGFVIGIDGEWGSGKSSLLFLIGDELSKMPPDRTPTVINFRPWLIGNREALITGLFGELSRQLDLVTLKAGDATPVSLHKAKEAGEALRSFMNGLGRTGSAIEFIGDASGIGLIKLAGQGIKAAGEAAGKEPDPLPLSELKDKLITSLRDLGHKFVITIDDVDRLEPAEVIEILRLVRSVMDLPNVVYLLCYDSDILGHSIETAVGVKSGKSYLEKIIQLTVMVPRPEELQLRQWFTDELHQIASAKDEEELSRLQRVIDYEGDRYLRTPRAVMRALDAIRFFWPTLRDAEADIADLVWLQLIKNGNPQLYRWIEAYCGTAAAMSVGTVRVEKSERAQQLAALLAVVPETYFSDETYRYIFSEQLPCADAVLAEDGTFALFEPDNDQKRDQAIRRKRLSSPDHYRLYFALSSPSHALTPKDFASVLSSANTSADEVGRALLCLQDRRVAGSLTKADLLLERIKGGVYNVLDGNQCENLLVAFSQVLDDAYRRNSFDQFWVNSLWDRAQRLIPLLLSRLEPGRRVMVVAKMFEKGAAIGWLTSLLRRETHAHGRHGDRPRPQNEWLFTDVEFDRVAALMLARYRAMSASDIFGCPNPISLLFAWNQAGDEQGAREFVQANIVTDEGLVETLEGLTSITESSSRGKLNVLKKNNIEPFLDYDSVRQRIDALRGHSDLGVRANRLAVAFDDAREF